MKTQLRQLAPRFGISLYHQALAILAALWYRFPSKRMTVIGVTGTNGKSTVSNLIATILESHGHTVGLSSTVNVKIGNRSWLNDTKMTMRGRFGLQKLLRRMVQAGCTHAIVETTSEGIKQYRHWGIDYDAAVFTNLTPEHIESHGSFERYKQAKGKLFATLEGKKNTASIVNLDDPQAEYFASFPANSKYGFTLQNKEAVIPGMTILGGTDVRDDRTGITFQINGLDTRLHLLGRFNAANALAAAAVGIWQNIPLTEIIAALEQVREVPGRMQVLPTNTPYLVIVDYAHEPAGLEQVYISLKKYRPKRIISVLGSQGGGRDKSKRAVMGELAGRYADYIVVTNEDPYDDNPQEIIDQVASGALQASEKIEGQHVFKILDREDGIAKALKLAGSDDIVIITGKGSEQNMVVEGGKKLPWNDEAAVLKLLQRTG
ncbi:MAG: UDP-N-acetylmuramoyl-L-alanyl-D-glutamate--2,6-diaminopimelate ligase [bacterium]|nr:UDP-N-acetylmuramoyl-L-alanyl-D-glutamate--2,6-diaminopimelate ligase [bacterium]